MLSHAPSDLACTDVTQGAQVKQEVVIGEGRLSIRCAAVVAWTTKIIRLDVTFRCLYMNVYVKKREQKNNNDQHYSHMSSEEGRDRILHS